MKTSGTAGSSRRSQCATIKLGSSRPATHRICSTRRTTARPSGFCVLSPVIPAPDKSFWMGCLGEIRETAHLNAQAARTWPSSHEAHIKRLRLDPEEVRVEGAMVSRAHHEPISWVIGSTICDGNDMGRIEDVQHPDLA